MKGQTLKIKIPNTSVKLEVIKYFWLFTSIGAMAIAIIYLFLFLFLPIFY